MLCILCISVSDEMLNIFDENGISLNISDIITKHFWMKPSAVDNNTKAICCTCWKTVESFHKFYETIEEAHTKLTTCLKFPIEKNDAELNHFEAFSDFFTPVVKLENSEDTKIELPETVETASVEVIDTVEKDDETKEALNSDSESEVPLFTLSNKASFVKDEKQNRDYESDSDNDDASFQDNEHKQISESESGSDSDSEYIKPKRKAKVKASSTFDATNKKLMPCKEFDSFIKQHMDIVCNICSKPLENFFCLKEHFKKAHKQNGYLTCCERQWTSRFSLVHHLIFHQNPDLYKCQKCGRVLANKKSFKNHMKTHLTQDPIHKCAKCKKLFPSIPKLQRHLKTHFRADTDQICDQCGKVYHSKQVLRSHQRREHLGFVKQRVQCTQCGVYLGDLSTLKFHTKHLHPKIKVVNSCDICGKVSATAYGLKRHIKYMHTMERVHKCTLCEDKAFKTAQMLREHMTTHTGEVLYTCPHCPKTFNSNANMHSHRKKMHRKEWEENRRHPHMGASANANVTEENNQQ